MTSMKVNMALRIFLVLLALMMTAGCATEPGAADRNRQHGKMSAPVTISWDLPRDLPAGETISVEVEVLVERAASDLILKVDGGKGVEVSDSVLERAHEVVAAGEVLRETFHVRAERDGIHYLRLMLVGTFDGMQMHQPKAIPLYIGGVVDAPAVQKSTNPLIRDDEGGPGLILMPSGKR